MFFKRLTQIACVFVVALVMTGCGKFLKGRSSEETLNDQIVPVSTGEIHCMKDAPKDLKDFFNDHGDKKVLSKTISCIQHSLKTFMRLTRGKVPNGYLAKEVQFFFNRNLLGPESIQINDEFLTEIMNLKVVVAGGSSDVVTRLELEQLVKFLGEIEKEVLKFQGLVRLVCFKADSSEYSPQKLALIRMHLGSIGQFILNKTKLTSSRYQLTDFIKFLKQLDLFMGESKVLAELLKWMPVGESVKLVFIGDSGKFVSDSDWKSSTEWVIHTYGVLLRFFYEIKGRDFTTPQEWKQLISWLDEAIERIETAPAMREKKILEASALDRLIDEVYDLQIFQTVLSKDLVKSTYRKALIHFIEAPAVRGDPLMISGLTDGHLRVLKHEYNIWKLSQTAINEIYSQRAKQNILTFREALKKFKAQGRIIVSPLEKEELNQSWNDFQNLVNSQPAIAFDGKAKVHISYHGEENELPFVGVNMMNSMRTYVRLALRGYGNRQSHINFNNFLSREKLIALQADFQDVAEAINFVDSRAKDSASKTFDQGDLLAYHSDGNGWLNATETYELLSLLISGGRTQLNEIYDDLERRKCLQSGKDIFGRQFVDEACFYRAFRQRFGTYFDHAPGAVHFMKKLSDQQWFRFFQGLLDISVSPGHMRGRLESSEIRSMTTVVNFIESLVRVYDRDQNGMLNEDEVVAAAPRFKQFISKVSPVGNFMIEDILLYMAYKGRKPGIADLTLFIAKRHTLGLGEVSKLNLIDLLSILKKDSDHDVSAN